MGSAFEYMREAVHRLQDMAQMNHDLWMELDSIMQANAGRVVLEDDADAGDLAQRMSYLIYNSIRMLKLTSIASEQMASITFEYIAHPDIRERLAMDALEVVTGQPMKAVHIGPFVMFESEDVVVPDTIPDEWNE